MTNSDQHKPSPEMINQTTIILGGETYACGLTWGHQGPGKPSLAYLIETSRSLGASSYVRYKDQIGYIPEHLNASNQKHQNGMIPAAAMVVDHFKDKSGTLLLVLLAGEHPSGESPTGKHSQSGDSQSERSSSKNARRGYLLVQARDGVIMPNGDSFFSDRETALAAFKKEMATEWDNIFISDTVLDGADTGPEGVEVFALDELVEWEIAGRLAWAGSTRIKPVPFNALRADNYKLWGGLSAGVLAILGGLYLTNEIIIPALNPIPEPVKITSLPLLTPSVSFVNPTALLEACFTGMQNPPTELYGWNLSKITCSPSGSKIGETGDAVPFDEPSHGREPTLGRGPTLTYEWTLGAGRNKAFWRRVAEKLLAKWQIAVVLDNTAFGLIPLTVAETTLEIQQLPQKADFRKQVDEVFGTVASNLQHSETGGLWTVKFSTPLSLHQLARRTAQIPGFQITSLSKAGNSDKQQSWTVEANLAQLSPIPGQGGFPQGQVASGGTKQ